MLPTYENGDVIRCTRDKKDIKRGDIVVFPYKHSFLVKRVVGIPGDVLYVKKGKLYINGGYENSFLYNSKCRQQVSQT